MNPLETIFLHARALTGPAERAAYLVQACGADAALRRRVEALLADANAAAAFFGEGDTTQLDETPPGAEPTAQAVLTEFPGAIIGRYKLLQQIGSGGMGVVYMAEQQEPVVRKVALKIIKLGMDTKEVVARFEAERQALALMDHPNIARVFDGGATETGRPYFVMELVKGIPITQFCDEQELDTRRRLELFIQVCSAVQHAHQKGIIHRDLKPSNIMVTLHGDQPVPKVIDFGIAKATDQRLTEKTLFTQFGQFIGTPAYMSPEQANFSGLDVDTRSDIYSLGVLLYELLVGKTPFDARSLLQAGRDEIRRVIREEEPPKPSTRLSTMAGGELTTVAKHRKSDPRKLGLLVRGDLDWIVMKALEKDRTRRYETANGLAADLLRHLDNGVVEARPPSAAYRFSRMVRRHRVAFAAGGAVAAALFLAVAASSWWAIQASRAQRAEALQKEQADEARTQAQNAEKVAQNARSKAEAKELETRLNLSATDFRLATHLVAEAKPSVALAYLARSIKENPTNGAAAARLCSLLSYHPWALPMARITCRNEITAAPLSADGSRMATLSDGVLQVWSTLTGEPLTSPVKEVSGLRFAAFSLDGKKLVTHSGNKDKTEIQLRDAGTGAPQWKSTLGSGHFYRASFSPDSKYVLTTSYDGTRVWDVNSGSIVSGPLLDHGFLSSKFSRDSKRLVTGSRRFESVDTATNTQVLMVWDCSHDGVPVVRRLLPEEHGSPLGADSLAWVWDLQTGRVLGKPMPHPKMVIQAEFNSAGDQLVTRHGGDEVRLWNATTGDLLSTSDSITNFYSEGFGEERSLQTSRRDRVVEVWDKDTKVRLTEPLRHPEAPLESGCSQHGTCVATSARDWMMFWDVRPAGSLGEPLRHATNVNSAAFSADGERVVTACQDGIARIWDSRSGRLLGATQKHPQYGMHFARFLPGGRRIITACGGTVQVWDAETTRAVGEPMNHGSYIWSVAPSADGKLIATTTSIRHGPTRLWDALTGANVGEAMEYSKDRLAVGAEFSPDGTRIVIGSDPMRIWNAHSGQLLLELQSRNDHRPHFSPDGAWVVGGSSREVFVWDARTGQRQTWAIQHAEDIWTARFSPDGQHIATASADGTARVWDARDGQPLAEPLEHGAGVLTANFSPDGLRLVTASHDGTARVWDVQSGRPLTDPLKHAGDVNSAEFSPDGQHVLTASDDGTARVWYVPPPGMRSPKWLPELAEAVAGQALNGKGLLEPADALEILKRIRVALAQKTNDDPWGVWGRWFLADRSRRTISPLSKTTVPQHIERLVRERSEESLDEAAKLARGDLEFRRRVFEARVMEASATRIQAATEQAQALARTGKLDAAVELLANLIAAGNTNLAGYLGILRERGAQRARRGQWSEALEDYHVAAELEPGEIWNWYPQASLLVLSDELVLYRQNCKAMLARFGSASDAPTLERAAKVCLLLTDAGVAPGEAGPLADKAVALGEKHDWAPYFQFTKGLAEYRRGHFTNAIVWTSKALVSLGVHDRDVQAYTVLAMANFRLSRTDEAQKA